ncbi:MAG: hypothetical protein LUJ09_05720 [Firmicutes bacterium]|nr:hypothetical protein [Bacillota bacterium]
MRRREGIEYTEFQELILERFDTKEMPYEKLDELNRGYIDWLLNAPEGYGVEEEMLKYAKENPEASLRELNELFDELAKDKDPPDFGGDDELEDE